MSICLSEYYDGSLGKGLSEEQMLSDSGESTENSKVLIDREE